jgi:hypothetical protein
MELLGLIFPDRQLFNYIQSAVETHPDGFPGRLAWNR